MRSRRGSLNLRLLPSMLIFRVTRVSGVGAMVDAMMEGCELLDEVSCGVGQVAIQQQVR
jgi:hypothetical protein